MNQIPVPSFLLHVGGVDVEDEDDESAVDDVGGLVPHVSMNAASSIPTVY